MVVEGVYGRVGRGGTEAPSAGGWVAAVVAIGGSVPVLGCGRARNDEVSGQLGVYLLELGAAG